MVTRLIAELENGDRVIEEDGTLYQEHTFYVHRYDAETPWQLRAHDDTLGRFSKLGEAISALEDREHPEYLHVEKRVEVWEIDTDEEETNGE